MKAGLTQFEELLEVVKSFGIDNFSKIKDQFERGEGLDVRLDDVFSTLSGELITILPDGSVRKSIIYIVDISTYYDEGWDYPKFHIYSCQMIKKMRARKRGHRYKASSRIDGKFMLIKNDEKWEEELKICSYCLRQYNCQFESCKTKENFSIKKYIKNPVRNFDFFESFDFCTLPNIYSENWKSISDYMKKKLKYRCFKCNNDFSKKSLKEFLHTHHTDGDKTNNTLGNLVPLCIECHSKESNHGHIKNSFQYKKYLKVKEEVA